MKERLTGEVSRLWYSSPGWSAGLLRTESGEFAAFAGRAHVYTGQQVTLIGNWVTHPKYGKQLQVSSVDISISLSPEGLAHYLATCPDFKGIGPVKAETIATVFGADFERVLENEPEKIAQVANLPLDVVQNVRTTWLEQTCVSRAMTALGAYELTYHQACQIIARYGTVGIQIVLDDPYQMVGEIEGCGFKRIDVVARKAGTDKEAPKRIRAGILYVFKEALAEGDCWLGYEAVTRADRLLALDGLDSLEIIETHIEHLVRENELVSVPGPNEVMMGLPVALEAERYVYEKLRGACKPPPWFYQGTRVDVGQTSNLTSEQAQAAYRGVTRSISVISGGAGTGKTYTVAAIARWLLEQDLNIVLCAPTGKAAKRIEESLGKLIPDRIPATTIHRLLGFNGQMYGADEKNPITADVVIVDEVSMLDSLLAWRLFKAIDLSRTSVILVGDHNQLPPIGPGSLLRDLTTSPVKLVPVTQLTQCVRQAGELEQCSSAVLQGKVTRAKVDFHAPWIVAAGGPRPQAAADYIRSLYERHIPEMGMDIRTDVQLLTPTHKGSLGTRALNTLIQRIVQERVFNSPLPVLLPTQRLLPGDRVIQTRNDYKLGIMNGTIGYVLEQDSDGKLTVDFDGEIKQIPRDSRALQLAYALTIHKAQGSEFPLVVSVIHNDHSFQHHRALLYTAVTRASRCSLIVGDHYGIDHCAAKVEASKRNTFISAWLAQAHGGAACSSTT